MTWSALANGSKGVFWFLYQSERVGAAMMDGLVDRDFKARPAWDEVGRLTKEIAPLIQTLAGLKNPREVKQDDPLLMVQQLTDSHGEDWLVGVDLDLTKTRRVKLGAVELDIAGGGGRLIPAHPRQ